MLVHEFDELMEAQPFVPFEMITADGRSVRVRSPEFAWHAPAARTIFVAEEADRVRIVDLHYVTQFVVGVAKANGRKKGRR